MFWFKSKPGVNPNQNESELANDGDKVHLEENRLPMEFTKVNLPPADTLEISKSWPDYIHNNFRLLEIPARDMIVLVQIGGRKENDFEVKLGQLIEAAITFHDGRSFEFEAILTKYYCNLKTQNQKLVCELQKPIPQDILNKEREYLRDNYNFGTESQTLDNTSPCQVEATIF